MKPCPTHVTLTVTATHASVSRISWKERNATTFTVTIWHGRDKSQTLQYLIRKQIESGKDVHLEEEMMQRLGKIDRFFES